MTAQVQLLLLALLILQIKHFVADFILQTPYQFLNKGTYGHPGGVIHAGIHALGTVLAFFIIPPSLGLAVAIMIGEFILHYHIDWMKERTVRKQQLKFPQAEFWWAFGADQAMHQATYIAIVAILAWHAGF